MQTAEQTTRRSTRLPLAWLTLFAIGCDLFVVSPLLPMIASDYAVPAASAGLSVTTFAAAYIVSAPVLGHLADRVGRARVLTCGLVMFGIANLLTASAGGLVWLLTARGCAGAAAAGVSPSIYALIGSAAPPNRRATWLAITVSGLLLSLSCGAPLGLLVAAGLGWPAVFAGLGGLSLVLSWANHCVWDEPRNPVPATTIGLRPTAAAICARLSATVTWSTALYGMYTYLGEGLTARGYSAADIAEAILFYGCGAIGGALLGGRMADRLGARETSAIGLIGMCLCLLLLRLALDTGVLVNCAFALASLAAQLFFPAQQLRLANDFPASRAAMLAWNNSALFLGISLGSLIGGQAVMRVGFDTNLTISAAIALLGWGINQTSGRPRIAVG